MTVLSLNGQWRFSIEQEPEYHRNFDYSQPTSLQHWDTVTVPGCWNTYHDRYALFEGVAWFVREFFLETLPPNPVAYLEFGGVNYLADIFVNGAKAGRHEGGYTAFSIDVTKVIRQGLNRLAVRVDNRQCKIRLPAVLGWYNYGGIHRDVRLNISPTLQIASMRINMTPENDGARGRITVNAVPDTQSALITVSILDSQGKCLWKSDTRGTGQWDFPVSLESASPWTPTNPTLYRCEVSAYDGNTPLDSYACSFGIRHLERKDSRLYLNGHPLYLRGICYLYDHPSTDMTFEPGCVKQDLDDLRKVGVNCLRSHFPVPDFFLDECDRRGIMLWLEVQIYCVAPPSTSSGSSFSSDSVHGLALQMLREMVEQAINHPSVIIWSVGNECNTEHPEALTFFRACVDQVRRMDNSRFISYASLYGQVGCAIDLVDIISINEYWGWYDYIAQNGLPDQDPHLSLPLEIPKLEACLKEKSSLGKPILLSEFGADAEPGFRNTSAPLWSEDYQAHVIHRQLEIASRYPAVAGTFPFLYHDYRDPSKPINHHWHGINLKGIVDYHRNHKLAWNVLATAYHEKRKENP